jgi:hypothetical protein
VNDARRPVVAVVSAGLKAPGGNTIEELWAALCAGRAFAEPFVDSRLPAPLMSSWAGFPASTRRLLHPVELRRLTAATCWPSGRPRRHGRIPRGAASI